MQGPDACYDTTESGLGGPNDDRFQFSGENGISYESFLQRIRSLAFEKGKSRDAAWMADLFSLHLSGNASKWFENLDDQTQQDWNLLKRAFIGKYGDAKLRVAEADRGNEKSKSTIDPLLPARIAIASWSSPVLSSTVRFPKSKDEWLREARQRKSKFSGQRGTVYWHLVESWQWVPENLIPVSLESGVTMYSIRAWQEGGLTLGKLALAGPSNPTKRAWIIWSGEEVPWSDSFEVLVGDESAVRWVTPRSVGKFTALEGGFEVKNNKALLVAVCHLKECTQPGKVFSSDSKAQYGWWGKEGSVEDFRVLAWA
ncbi:hypothetical protein M407DRAFT_28493 [Tulasnella calospora MUT 4182]|uniref:Retrotransposon gag domain-containing protein n=1 Tax=Tulasnella calospora MUT 4182 TaxID=1051891 RepID=A0A0C3Q1A3_9AGAM|nr:hypothetical protein M407DRAFT_28493 [Tulasnella calospora MUT 4182]